jgi:hypothetical protein
VGRARNAAVAGSWSEGARLKINVFDGPGPGHDATFELTRLADAIDGIDEQSCQKRLLQIGTVMKMTGSFLTDEVNCRFRSIPEIPPR